LTPSSGDCLAVLRSCLLRVRLFGLRFELVPGPSGSETSGCPTQNGLYPGRREGDALSIPGQQQVIQQQRVRKGVDSQSVARSTVTLYVTKSPFTGSNLSKYADFLRNWACRTGRFPQLVDPRSRVNRDVSPLLRPLASIRRPPNLSPEGVSTAARPRASSGTAAISSVSSCAK
jgi:hypothetical protein